jgi:hypothetical protein
MVTSDLAESVGKLMNFLYSTVTTPVAVSSDLNSAAAETTTATTSLKKTLRQIGIASASLGTTTTTTPITSGGGAYRLLAQEGGGFDTDTWIRMTRELQQKLVNSEAKQRKSVGEEYYQVSDLDKHSSMDCFGRRYLFFHTRRFAGTILSINWLFQKYRNDPTNYIDLACIAIMLIWPIRMLTQAVSRESGNAAKEVFQSLSTLSAGFLFLLVFSFLKRALISFAVFV